MSDVPFYHDGGDITAAPGARPGRHSVPDDGSLRITRQARPPRLVLAGDIDQNSHAALIAALAEAADGTGQVHIDMAGMNFCDVKGLRIILRGGDGRQPARVRAILHNLPPPLVRLLRLLDRGTATGGAPCLTASSRLR